MIEAITFDLWNTLFTNISYMQKRIAILAEYLNSKGFHHANKTLKNTFYQCFDLIHWESENISDQHVYNVDRFNKLITALNIRLNKREIKNLVDIFEDVMLENIPSLKMSVKKTLRTLAPDFKIGLISDTGITPGRIIRHAMDKHEILKYFDITIFSDETGFYKPHPKAFQSALNKLNVKPENAIHIGDNILTDIKGANSFNMISIWINDSNSLFDSNIHPNHVITDIYEVVSIIRNNYL